MEETTPLKKLTASLCQPTEFKGRRVRALNPWGGEDGVLLEAISRGEFAINGLRNRDIQGILYEGEAETQTEKGKRSSKISRQLRLLRAHGLIQKVTRTHRYVLTERGRTIVIALLAARSSDTKTLTKLAA